MVPQYMALYLFCMCVKNSIGAANKGMMVSIIHLSQGFTQPVVHTIPIRLGGRVPLPMEFTMG